MELSNLLTIILPLKGNADALRYSLLLEPYLGRINAKFILITDEEFDNKVKDSTFDLSELSSGWHKQQYIKLLVAEMVDTPWYLCLDSDCFFTKFDDVDEMFFNESKTKAFYNDETGCHANWWELAAKSLATTVPEVQCGVTPMVLNTNHTLSLLKHFGKKRIKKFINRGATEYTLYWTYNTPYSLYENKPISHGVYPQEASKKCFIDNPKCYINISNEPWHSFPVGLVQSTMKHNPFKLAESLCHILK